MLGGDRRPYVIRERRHESGPTRIGHVYPIPFGASRHRETPGAVRPTVGGQPISLPPAQKLIPVQADATPYDSPGFGVAVSSPLPSATITDASSKSR